MIRLRICSKYLSPILDEIKAIDEETEEGTYVFIKLNL
jgi:hypothetical protein